MLEKLMADVGLLDMVFAAVAVLIGWACRRFVVSRLQDARMIAAWDALAVGVHQAWEDYGKAVKHAAKDGKFTDEEKIALRTRASTTAIEIARGQGFSLLKVLTPRMLDWAIKTIVDRRKAAAK